MTGGARRGGRAASANRGHPRRAGDLPTHDLDRVQRLRDLFLEGRQGKRAIADYWRGPEDLAAYDAVLGARIGWKWDAALNECERRGWRPSGDETVLDFGCGAGVAARRYVARFGAGRVLCHDRSPHATTFAVARLREEQPSLDAQAVVSVRDVAADVVLVSHVVSELDDRGLQQLEEVLRRTPRAILVESGNRPVARRLAGLRDRLLDVFRVLAPCTHQGGCPTLADADNWCHFFASPPSEIFTDGAWVKAARSLGIDLRSLPYAFVALDRGDVTSASPTRRVLGRAAISPVVAKAQACAPSGIESVEVTKRQDAKLWRSLKKNPEHVDALLREDR